MFLLRRRNYIRSAKIFGAAALVFTMAGLTFADDTHDSNKASKDKGIYANADHLLNPGEIDHRLYHRSGTAGRMGLGASPLHPEGPGNARD